LILHPAASGLYLNAKSGTFADGQLIGIRGVLKQIGDLPPSGNGQKAKALGFKLKEDQVFFGEQPPDGDAGARGAGSNQPAVDCLVNRSEGQAGQGSRLGGRISIS
jgi:hypothetical protein